MNGILVPTGAPAWGQARRLTRHRACPWMMLLLVFCLTGCSIGSIGLRVLYSRFDNTLNERILSYAEFDPGQQAVVEQAVEEFVSWHRTRELPRYAAFVAGLRERVASGRFDEDALVAKLERVRTYSDEVYERSPLANAGAFLRGLSDAQVDQIGEAFARREERYREWREERAAEGEDGRLRRIVRNVKRFGVTLDDGQERIIARGLSRYRWQPGERGRLRRQWEAKFLDLLSRRAEAGFTEQVEAHLAGYRELSRRADPERYAWNQRNTARIVNEVLLSLAPDQQRALEKRLEETSRTLLDMAEG